MGQIIALFGGMGREKRPLSPNIKKARLLIEVGLSVF